MMGMKFEIWSLAFSDESIGLWVQTINVGMVDKKLAVRVAWV